MSKQYETIKIRYSAQGHLHYPVSINGGSAYPIVSVHSYNFDSHLFKLDYLGIHYLVMIDFDFTGGELPARMTKISVDEEAQDQSYPAVALMQPLMVHDQITQACCAYMGEVVIPASQTKRMPAR